MAGHLLSVRAMVVVTHHGVLHVEIDLGIAHPGLAQGFLTHAEARPVLAGADSLEQPERFGSRLGERKRRRRKPMRLGKLRQRKCGYLGHEGHHVGWRRTNLERVCHLTYAIHERGWHIGLSVGLPHE